MEWLFYLANRSFKFTDKGRKLTFTFGLLLKLIELNPEKIIVEGFLQWTPLAVLYSFCLENLYILLLKEQSIQNGIRPNG